MNIYILKKEISKFGTLFNDVKNNGALTYRSQQLKHDIVWKKTESYKEFLLRCLDAINQNN